MLHSLFNLLKLNQNINSNDLKVDKMRPPANSNKIQRIGVVRSVEEEFYIVAEPNGFKHIIMKTNLSNETTKHTYLPGDEVISQMFLSII